MSVRVERVVHGGAVGHVPHGLRSWAAGSLADEAAVGLLLRVFEGRFAERDCAWVRRCARPGWYWLDGDALASGRHALSVEERAVLGVVAGLVGAPVDPVSCLDWLEGHLLCLAEAAVAQASECPGCLGGVILPAGRDSCEDCGWAGVSRVSKANHVVTGSALDSFAQGQRVPRIRPEIFASSFHAMWADGAVQPVLPFEDRGAA